MAPACRLASMWSGAIRRDQFNESAILVVFRHRFNVARRDSPGSGTLRSVLWRRHLRYLLRALASDALNAACTPAPACRLASMRPGANAGINRELERFVTALP